MADNKRSLSRRFLPPDPHAVEPYRLTPKLALRVGILGMLALAVFATLFLRLWSLQVLNGEQLLRAAQNNQRRDIRVQAPRGPILDRNGDVLVTNVPGPRGSDLVVRLAEAARSALARDPRARAGPRASGQPDRRGDQTSSARPADADQDQGQREPGPGLLPRGEGRGLPGRPDRAGLPALLPQSGACRARARLRQRDLAGAGGGSAQPGVQGRRHDRPDRDRVVLRQVSAWDRRCLAVARRLARQADQPRRAEGPVASRQRRPPDARREVAEGRGGRAAVRHRTRAQLAVLRLLVLERRRDRRARSAGRLDPRARVVPDVSAVALSSVACASGRSTSPV